MTDSDDKEISLNASMPEVGERLRKAREARQLTVVEAATQLRLPRDVLNNLEQEHWERLHGRTYARGYFSSYVKFLGLDHDELIQQFNLSYTEVERPTVVAPMKQQLKDSHGLPILPVIVLIVLGFVAWLAYSNKDTLMELITSGDPQLTESFDDASDIETLAPASGFSRSVEPIVETPAPTVNETFSDNQFSPAPEPVSESSPLSQSLMLDDSSPLDAFQSEAETATTASAEPSQRDPRLQLSFTDECWVEVIDADSRTLLSRVMRAGEQITLEGTLPLNVLLGRASAATVEFNNEVVDISGYIQGNVARFSLGTNS